MRTEPTFEERFVCVVSRDHPFADIDDFDLDQYLACSHVVVDILEGRQGALDHRLEARGTPRRASVTVSYHSAAAAAVPGTKLVATLPWRLVRAFTTASVLVIAPPREIEPMTYSMLWHPRLDNDAAQRWLRDLVRATAPEDHAGPT